MRKHLCAHDLRMNIRFQNAGYQPNISQSTMAKMFPSSDPRWYCVGLDHHGLTWAELHCYLTLFLEPWSASWKVRAGCKREDLEGTKKQERSPWTQIVYYRMRKMSQAIVRNSFLHPDWVKSMLGTEVVLQPPATVVQPSREPSLPSWKQRLQE